jgi:hypothetical protein
LSGAKPDVARTGVEERLNGGFGAEATVNCGRERGRGTDLSAFGAAFVAGFAAALVALAVGFLIAGFAAAFLSEGLAWSGFAPDSSLRTLSAGFGLLVRLDRQRGRQKRARDERRKRALQKALRAGALKIHPVVPCGRPAPHPSCRLNRLVRRSAGPRPKLFSAESRLRIANLAASTMRTNRGKRAARA